jgi:hypothetical protein
VFAHPFRCGDIARAMLLADLQQPVEHPFVGRTKQKQYTGMELDHATIGRAFMVLV